MSDTQPPAPAPAPAPVTPVAVIPPVADTVTPESQQAVAIDYSAMGPTDEAIMISGEELATVYVGKAKSNKYRTAPIGDMMPAHFYRATSTFAQGAMANLRWTVANFLHRVCVIDAESILPPQWLMNLPAHLQFEAALELARVHPQYRRYALLTMALMTASSKARGVPDVTPKSNPYTAVFDERVSPAMRSLIIADMVCSMRITAAPSPYAMFGRAIQLPTPDPVHEWVKAQRDPSYRTPVMCHDEILNGIRAGLRLWRGVGARTVGEAHDTLVQVSSRPLDPAAPLYDTNIQVVVGADLSHWQNSDTVRYLDVAPALKALITDPRYASYMQTIMAPPTDGDSGVVVYTETYHESLTSALKRVPRWSWAFPDSAGELNRWESSPDPKPMGVNSTGIMRNFQAIGLFGATVGREEIIEGVALPLSMVSRVDPLLVSPDGYAPNNYAVAKARMAQGLASLAASMGNVDGDGNPRLLPSHNTALKAIAEDESAWTTAQAGPEHKAALTDLVGEMEHKLQILFDVMAERAVNDITSQLGGMTEQLCASAHPAAILAHLDLCIRNAAGWVAPSPEAQG